MNHIPLSAFLRQCDLEIKSIQAQKQWYLDYRCGSGMTPMLEEFVSVLDKIIAEFDLIKQIATQIEPSDLLTQSRNEKYNGKQTLPEERS